MSTTPDFGLPLIASQQATPEVTHNEALYLLQVMLNGVISFGGNTPPGSPTVGDSYIVGSAPTGAWNGKANKLAIYTAGGWRFLPGADSNGTNIAIGARHKGLHVWVRNDGGSPAGGGLYFWSGTAWTLFEARVPD